MTSLSALSQIKVRIDGARGPIGLDLIGTPSPGQFVVFNADRKVQGASGTGADEGLRTDLAAGDGSALAGFSQSDTGAVDRSVLGKLREMPAAPEDYAGDIQATIDAVEAAASVGVGTHAPVQLRQFARYTLTAGLTLDTLRSSLLGYSTIDASQIGATTALTVDCTAAGEAGNSYLFKGAIKGNIRMLGAGINSSQIGIKFSSLNENGAAQLLVENMALGNFGIGIQFANRAYNSLFTKAEISGCGVCLDWPVGGQDNNERNTLVGHQLYNSGIAIRGTNPDATIYNYGGSIDFTQSVVRASNGFKVRLTDMHMESDRWGEDSYAFSVEGSGGVIDVRGGLMLNHVPEMETPHLAFVGEGARMDIDGTFIHNLTLTRDTPDSPTAFFNGPGVGMIRNTHGFDGLAAARPDRVNTLYTCLADPSFESASWDDLVWLTDDSAPITDRRTGQNLTITKVMAGRRSGTQALSANKVNGAGTSAAFGLLRLPVRWGDKVMAGFHYASAAGNPAGFEALWRWARFDRFDANGLPVWYRSTDALMGHNGGLGEVLNAGSAYQMMSFGKVPGEEHALRMGLSGVIAPPWATDFICIIRLNNAPAGSLLIDDIWADRW